MKAWMLLALLLPVAPLLTSCGDKDTVVEVPANQSASVQALIKEADSLSYSISTSSLLRSNSERDKSSMVSLVQKVKMAAMKLSLVPTDKVALQILIDCSNEYKTVQILNAERPQFDKFFQLVSEVISETNGNVGGTFNLSSATLFAYNFSNGLKPFGTFASKTKWETRESLDVFSARVRDHKNKAWLVSPIMDLSKIDNPRIQIRHSIQNEAFDGQLPNAGKIFKLKISRVFAGGDPNKSKWDNLKIKNFPTGIDFHTIDSEEIDLSEYRNEKVTIAFLFDTSSRKLGNGRYGWTIERFNLLGAGATPKLTVPNLIPVDKNTYVLKREFLTKGQQNLNGFTGSSTVGKNDAFSIASHNDNYFIKIGGAKDKKPILAVGEYTLTSEVLKVPVLDAKTSVKVSMYHALAYCNAGKCNPKDVVQLQIAEKLDNAEDQKWITMEFSDDEFPSNSSKWDRFESGRKGDVKVPQEFSGKNIQVRLKFKQIENSTYIWQVTNLKLQVIEGK